VIDEDESNGSKGFCSDDLGGVFLVLIAGAKMALSWVEPRFA
jgi:hypothetical protein